jgi:hypothetical protein
LLTYFFSDRGEFRWESAASTDLAINYSLPIAGLQLFAQAELRNAFNEEAQISGNTSVFTAESPQCRQGPNGPQPGARCLPFNPFTDVPVEGTHWQKGPRFGQPTTATTWATLGSFQVPRTYLFSAGLRF